MPTSFSLADLAARLGAEVVGDPAVTILGVAELADARPGQLAPLLDLARLDEAGRSQASAVLVSRHIAPLAAPQLVHADPRRVLGLLLELFGPAPPAEQGVDPRAAVDASAKVDPGAWVGPFAYVGPRAAIAADSRVEPFCYVGAGASVGRRCTLGPGAMLAAGCRLEDDVALGAGAVIGSPGFGFWRDDMGWRRIPSAGSVTLGAGSDIGALSCVDRGTLGATRIGRGAKIDNLVQVGHNVRVGDRALLCAQVGLAGSVDVGEDAVLAGQVGVADHRRVGSAARVGGHSGVAQDVPDGAEVSGYPALPHRRWLRASALFRRLAELSRAVQELRREVARLVGAASSPTDRSSTGEDGC
jgi:UDP-3-O-[3-hydroxymyristoyl] glucosamine N-acyltransferase